MKRLMRLLLAGLFMLSLITTVFASDDEDTDSIPPELQSIAVNQITVYPGGKIIVSADARDDDSGVKSITATFVHDADNTEHAVTLLLTSDDTILKEYSGDLYIPQNAATGRYRLKSVLVRDREGNRARYMAGRAQWDDERGFYPLKWDISFTVVPGSQPPEPISCAVTRTNSAYWLSAAFGETELDKATLLFENAENGRKYVFSVCADDLQTDGSYRKAFSVSPHEPPGTFALKQIAVKAVSGEKRTWSDTADEETDELVLPVSCSFTIKSQSTDTTPPEFLGVTVGAGIRDNKDEKVRYPIQARATDDLSGVEHIAIKFKDQVSGESVSKVLRPLDRQRNGLYSGELSVKLEQKPGRYILDSVTVCDYAGNRATYCTQADLTDKKRLLPVECTITINK